MTENERQRLYQRLRAIHRAERRRAWLRCWLNAWLRGRGETLALGGACCAAAWVIWKDHTIESACLAGFGLLIAASAFT